MRRSFNGKSPARPDAGGKGLQIRVARRSDARDLAALASELGYPTDPAEMRRRLAEIGADASHLIAVAVSGRTVVGWMHAHACLSLESGWRVEIMGLIVAPGARRQGVGRQLVRRAEAWAVEVDVPVLVVRSNRTRKESHRFYPALGFAMAKTQVVYRLRLADTPPAGGGAGGTTWPGRPRRRPVRLRAQSPRPVAE